MRTPLFISAIAHLLVLVASIVALPFSRELPPLQTRVLPAELLTVKEYTNLLKKVPTPIEEPKPVEEEKPKIAERVPEPEPEPEPEVEAAPTPPDEAKPQPEPEKKAEIKKEEPKPEKKPTPAKKPESKKPKREFDPNALAKLLNKLPDDAAPRQETRSAEVEDNSSPTTDDPTAELSMSEIDAFRQKMEKCWIAPIGAPDPGELVVKIKVYLNQDGTLAKPPELQGGLQTLTGSTYYRASAEAAMRAIRRCAPYDMLPQDRYSRWKELMLNFDPRDMLGG